jgi:hypothetical protein
MFESTQYIAQEYLYNNRIYKGRFPVAITEKQCPLGGYVPPSSYERGFTNVTTLREELDENDLLLIELETPTIITNRDGSKTEIKYVNTENSTNPRLNQKGIHVTI